MADRVNLGLIPSSQMSYLTALKALKRNVGGILHIHGNVDRRKSNSKVPKANNVVKDERFNCKYQEWENWALETCDIMSKHLESMRSPGSWSFELMEMICVKSYAPKVDHLVLDLKCIFK